MPLPKDSMSQYLEEIKTVIVSLESKHGIKPGIKVKRNTINSYYIKQKNQVFQPSSMVTASLSQVQYPEAQILSWEHGTIFLSDGVSLPKPAFGFWQRQCCTLPSGS
jgi:hypothetical protein